MADTRTAPQFLTTREVAALLRVRERKVYDMASAGEIPCRRVTGKLLFPRAAIESWLAGPSEASPPDNAADLLPNVIAGSHDPLLDWALREARSGITTIFDGSLDGLNRLETGEASACGLHIIEPDQGDWNIDHVRRSETRHSCVLLEWAGRNQGLMFEPRRAGELAGIEGLSGRRIALRQETAGSRILLEHLLRVAGLTLSDVDPVPALARTETEAATMVASGEADVALGLETAARQFGLEFLPVSQERYDLLIRRKAFFEPAFQALFSFCRTEAFKRKVTEMGGYDVSDHGRVRWNGP